MPRNRPFMDRDDKRAELVEAARRLFLTDGYAATTVSRLAREAGVATNTLYWYFEDKDDVLLAVVDVEVAKGWRDYRALSKKRVADRLFWLVERLQEISLLVATVHERAAHSERVRAWHDRFHEALDAAACEELAALGVPAARRQALAKIWGFTIEGLLAHPLETSQQRAICQALVVGFGTHTSRGETGRRK